MAVRESDVSQIGGRTIYTIMKKHGPAEPCPAKSTRRKRARFGRMYSNAIWHAYRADYEVFPHEGPKPHHVSGSCVTGHMVSGEASSVSAVKVSRHAVGAFGCPAIPSYNGSCLAGVRKDGVPKGTRTPDCL